MKGDQCLLTAEAKRYKYIGSRQLAKLARAFGEQPQVVANAYLKLLQKGEFLPLFVIDGNCDKGFTALDRARHKGKKI